MPEAILAANLAGAVRQVLESMFFTEPLGPAEGPFEQPVIAVALRFEGAARGCFRLRLEETEARRLAADFLGEQEEEDSDRDRTGEVICEMANMICGAALSHLGKHQSLRLGSPQLLAPDAEPNGGRCAARVLLELEAGRIELTLEMEPAS